ncbi:hypothetical protein BABINDRAFT_168181 [Babjeviella inositovora NRRL Y-12698]|uniref:Uncharacterized protein n=1 Tax=Babjeviella inositovora NRRL Y-12698 TaxID=984486 RepID=A0A1E3QN71_9ASCO|nr:uncharacterized protein BABINDRAFT_168181 [Babjeviella inositovora NRRL Y-12698]ODQ78437.1 hypothetical protein BABINDRAFT_168181 [Babjeviella inositovora NRRL Y-12698]
MFSRIVNLGLPRVPLGFPLHRILTKKCLFPRPALALNLARPFSSHPVLYGRPPRQGSGGSTRASYILQRVPDKIKIVGGIFGIAAFASFVVLPFLSLMIIVLPPVLAISAMGLRRKLQKRAAANTIRWKMIDKSDMQYDRPANFVEDIVADFDNVARFTTKRLLRSLELNEKKIVDKLNLRLDTTTNMPKLSLGEIAAVDAIVRVQETSEPSPIGEYMYMVTVPLSIKDHGKTESNHLGTVVLCFANSALSGAKPKMVIEVTPQTLLLESKEKIYITSSMDDVDDGETITINL